MLENQATVIVLLFCCWITFITQIVDGINVRLTPTRIATHLNGDAVLHCEFSPTPAYISWSFSNSGQDWRKVALCHTISQKCRIEEDFVTANWTVSAYVNGTLEVRGLKPSQDGHYQCEGIHNVDAARSNATVTVLTRPETPVLSGIDVILQEGQQHRINCSSSGGNPPPQIEWFLKRTTEEVIKKINLATLILPQKSFGITVSMLDITVSAQDHGASLRCQARNVMEITVESPNTVLNVQYKPIIAAVVSPSVIVGSDISLQCSVNANPQATVYFKQNERNLSKPQQIDSLHFPITAVPKTLRGNLSCVAANSLGTSERGLYLDVLYPPEVTVPRSVSVREKALLQLECIVDANPPPVLVRWVNQKTGTPQVNGTVLSIPQAARADAGLWLCEASNVMRPTIGAPVQKQSQGTTEVSVEYLPGQPSITISMNKILVDSNVTLVCESNVANPGVPVPIFAWTRSGTVGFDKSGAFLRLQSVQLQDNGVYFCTPSNSLGKGPPASIDIEVEQAPQWITPHPRSPLSVRITQRDYYIDCEVRAKPQANIKWFKDQKEIDSKKYTVSNEFNANTFQMKSTLHFRGSARSTLSEEDVGLYMCSAQNTHGKVLSSVQLEVKFPPRILSTAVKVALRQTVSLECPIVSQPEPDVHWTISGVPISGNMIRDSVKSYLYSASLVGVNKLGTYKCVAKNSEGEASHTFEVVESSSPEPPRSIQLISKSWDMVSLQWEPTFDGGFPATFWIKYYGQDMATAASIAMQTRLCDTPTATNISDLYPNTNYTFQVFASNSAGQGTLSPPIGIVTDHLPIPAVIIQSQEREALIFSAAPGYCIQVSMSKDEGISWGMFHRCILSEQGRIDNLDMNFKYKLSLCLKERKSICGPEVTTRRVSGFPEVSTSTIIIVGSACGVLILILIAILIFFCCRRRAPAKDYADAGSPQRRIQPDITNNSTYKSYHSKPYAMVSPHPSLTSTDDTMIDNNKVFTTLLSANHPINNGHFDGSGGSDTSATLFLNSNSRPKKVIYEVVV